MQHSEQQQRLVVKVGSQVLCNTDGELNLPVLASLAEQISSARSQGWQVVLVSSGAVASGAGVWLIGAATHSQDAWVKDDGRLTAFVAIGGAS